MDTVTDFVFLGSKITVDGGYCHERKAMTNLDKLTEKQRHHCANKVLSSQSYGFSSSHAQM